MLKKFLLSLLIEMLTILLLIRDYFFPVKRLEDAQTQTEPDNRDLEISYIDAAYDAYNSRIFKKIFDDL